MREIMLKKKKNENCIININIHGIRPISINVRMRTLYHYIVHMIFDSMHRPSRNPHRPSVHAHRHTIANTTMFSNH